MSAPAERVLFNLSYLRELVDNHVTGRRSRARAKELLRELECHLSEAAPDFQDRVESGRSHGSDPGGRKADVARRLGTESAPSHSRDPVFYYDSEDDLAGWYFSDETWTDARGPFPTEAVARASLTTYAYYVENGPGFLNLVGWRGESLDGFKIRASHVRDS